MVRTRSTVKAMMQAATRQATNIARRAAEAAIPIAVDRIVNNVITPSRTGRNMPGTPAGPQNARTAKWGSSYARYVGRFKKVYKKKGRRYQSRRSKFRKRVRSYKKMKKNEMVECLKYGYHITNELYGTLTDPHIGYIIHSTNEYNGMVRCIVGAMVRKLFKKAGVSVETRSQTLPLFNNEFSGPNVFVIKWIRTNFATNQQTEHLYEIISNTAGLDDIINGLATLTNHIVLYLQETGAEEITHMRLYMRTTALPADERRLVSELDLKNEEFHFVSTSKLKVQNRTKGDTNGSDNDADRVDNMPVYGKLYDFKGGNIKMRTVNNSDFDYNLYFNSMPANGLSLITGTQLPEYEEPPTGKHFMNNGGQSKVYLNPGDIKYATISYNYSGKFKNFIDKFKAKNFVNQINAPFRYGGIPGKTQMIALEEVIRSISSNPIVLVYERQITLGVYMTSKKRAVPLTTQLTSEQISNLAPT